MLIPVTMSLLEGMVTTLKLFFLTLVFALPLGLIISFGSMSRFAPLRWLVQTMVWIIRGSPLMIQILIIFYGPGLLFGLPLLPRFTAWSTMPAIFPRFTGAAFNPFPRGSMRRGRFWA